MVEETKTGKRRKGEVARQRVLESALHLFRTKGYETTTMREIAAEAGYSPGLTYRYFASKEELVLVLYQDLTEELEHSTRDLPTGSLSERFYLACSRQLTLIAPHHETLGALFGTALNPRSRAGVFGESTADVRRMSRKIYLQVVQGTRDAPRVSQHEDLATVLYGAHMAIILFWLIDQSRESRRTWRLLALLRTLLKLVQPILWLPLVSQALSQLAEITGPLLGDDRYRETAEDEQEPEKP